MKSCKNYNLADKCVTYVRDDTPTTTYRGCKSDASSICVDNTCEEDEPSKNNAGGNVETLKCYKCSTLDGQADCATAFGAEVVCPTLLGRDVRCYVYQDATKFERGCLRTAPNDLASTCDADPNCFPTYGELTNTKNDLPKCVVCDSTNEALCGTDPSGLAESDCISDATKTGCFLKIDGKL